MVKKQDNYILLENEDLIIALEHAGKKKGSIYLELQDLFLNDKNVTDNGSYKIEYKENIYKYLKKVDGITFEEEGSIAFNLLEDSLIRAIYEYNHEMEKSLKKYMRLLMDAKINKDDEKLVIDLILADEKVMEYIKKYKSMDDYVLAMIKKRIDVKPKVEKQQQATKNRSHVIM